MVNSNHCFSKNSTIIYKELDGATVLIDPYRRTIVNLNDTAREVWHLLDGQRPVAGVIEAMREGFDIDEVTLRKDVLSFLDELAKREMIA
jgi:hypothetical protein